jgi:hypothetical protein
METEQKQASRRRRNLKKGAKIALVLIMLNVVGQLATVYQTRHHLASPLIPESAIWQVNKQFVFLAIVSAVVSLLALLLYFFEKYVFVIVLVALTMIASRYIYV